MRTTRVLVVDDEIQVLGTLSAVVARNGFDVISLASFEDAKRRIVWDPPDMLVTDIRLGRYNGLQLVVLMRDARPDSTIVVLSASDDVMLRREAARFDADYLVKPVPAKRLVESLGGPVGARPNRAEVRFAHVNGAPR